MLADIFITTKDRTDIFETSLKSFDENTSRDLYRLTIICDGSTCIPSSLIYDMADHVLVHSDNLGLGPSINQALTHINTLNRYYSDSRVGDPNKVSEFICYCQDDLLYSDKWLEKLTQFFLMFETQKKIGFASGVECIEHEVKDVVGKFQGQQVVTKDWIRAANMFARRDYWMSMFPIPLFDPETGRARAKPNNGMGSGVDWHFIRNHENSVCKTGRSCLVLPGLIKHFGYNRSTWLDRDLPESEEDKNAIQEKYLDELVHMSEEFGGYNVDQYIEENLEKPDPWG